MGLNPSHPINVLSVSTANAHTTTLLVLLYTVLEEVFIILSLSHIFTSKYKPGTGAAALVPLVFLYALAVHFRACYKGQYATIPKIPAEKIGSTRSDEFYVLFNVCY